MDSFLLLFTKRPYVIAFLVSYLVIASRAVNIRFVFQYLICGYTIAFLSEYLSINYGFPYGWYHYIYDNLQGEWLNNGVPVWDSASYVFMCFSGLYLSTWWLRKIWGQKESTKSQFWTIVFVSAVFTTLLDVIVDPVSHQGKDWFLGQIYYYPNPGWYFDITMANFGGWLLTSFCINAAGFILLRFGENVRINPLNSFLAIGLYFGIFGFGLSIAIYLQDWPLVLVDLAWLLALITILTLGAKKVLSPSKNIS